MKSRAYQFFKISLLIVFIVCAALLVVSCDEHIHSYKRVITKAPTCTEKGEVTLVCDCGVVKGTEEVGPDIHHTRYVFDENGHAIACKNCDYVEEVEEHNLCVVEDKWLNSTCEKEGFITYSCLCGYEKTDILPKHDLHFVATSGTHYQKCSNCDYQTEPVEHNFETLIFSSAATCQHEGEKIYQCECGQTQTTVLDILDHEIFYFKAKPATETEKGNRNYWRCENCGKYFSSKNCEKELTEDEVFFSAPQTIEVANLSALNQIAEQLAANSEETEFYSRDYYKLTLLVLGVTDNGIELWDGENDDTVTVALPSDVEANLKEDYSVTLKTFLYIEKEDSDFIYEFSDTVILDVDNGATGEYNLFVERVFADDISESNQNAIVAHIEYGEDFYYSDTKYFNVLMPELEDTLTVTIYNYAYNSDVKLEKVIVNGEVRTVPNGILTITVTGDVYVKLVFTNNPSASVTLNMLDTSAQDERQVDEYVSYKYSGAYNDFGRLYRGSHLTFTVSNASIVKIVITYADYNLSGEETVLDNTIKVGEDKDHATAQKQDNFNESNHKVILEFDEDFCYVYFDYFADVCQARLAEITIEYATANNFASY